MREQLQKAINEAFELRTKLNSLGEWTFTEITDWPESEKSTGVSEVASLKSTHATLEETISRQKLRIETLEASHKDTLTLLEKKNGEISRNEEEYKQIQTKYIEARREISTTENALQEAQGQVSTLSYKEQSLQQEVEFLKKDNDRLIGELNTKASDFSTYRKEKVCLDLFKLTLVCTNFSTTIRTRRSLIFVKFSCRAKPCSKTTLGTVLYGTRTRSIESSGPYRPNNLSRRNPS
jgi:chromosome segregation ATPase